MAEYFDVEVRVRALNMAYKLRADQLEYINTFLGSKDTTSVQVEETFDRLTGFLLEPVIARYWMDNKKVVLQKENY